MKYLTALVCFIALAVSNTNAAPAERVVLISVDGLTTEDSTRLDGIGADTPTCNALVANSVRARGVVPTTGAYIDNLLADVPGDVRTRGKYVYASATLEIRDVLQSPEKAGEMTDELRLQSVIASRRKNSHRNSSC